MSVSKTTPREIFPTKLDVDEANKIMRRHRKKMTEEDVHIIIKVDQTFPTYDLKKKTSDGNRWNVTLVITKGQVMFLSEGHLSNKNLKRLRFFFYRGGNKIDEQPEEQQIYLPEGMTENILEVMKREDFMNLFDCGFFALAAVYGVDQAIERHEKGIRWTNKVVPIIHSWNEDSIDYTISQTGIGGTYHPCENGHHDLVVGNIVAFNHQYATLHWGIYMGNGIFFSKQGYKGHLSMCDHQVIRKTWGTDEKLKLFIPDAYDNGEKIL